MNVQFPSPFVYFQVSRRYRIVVRLPEGKSGIQILSEVSGKPQWALQLGEAQAGDYYLRVYAESAGLWLKLTVAQWNAWRAAGGRTYS